MTWHARALDSGPGEVYDRPPDSRPIRQGAFPISRVVAATLVSGLCLCCWADLLRRVAPAITGAAAADGCRYARKRGRPGLGTTLIGAVLAIGVLLGFPSVAVAAVPVVSSITVTSLYAGSAAAVSYQVDDPAATVTCQWQSAGTSATPGTWTNISGATACNNYSAASADNGKWMRIQVSATNASGTGVFASRAYRLGGEVWGNVGCGLSVALANGSVQSAVVPSPGGGAFCYEMPDSSPDGRLVVFRRQQTSSSKPDIWLMNGARTAAMQLTDTPSLSESEPRFSPDGSRLAWLSVASGPDRSVWVYNVATGLATEFGPFADTSGLEWLDNGHLVFFSHSRSGGTFSGAKWRYYTGWPGKGTGRTVETSVTCPYEGGTQRCTFISEIWELDVATGAATQRTETNEPVNATEYDAIRSYKINPRHLRVSPDGAMLVHNNSQNGKMLQISTSTWAQTWTGFHSSGYAWRSDGMKIFWSKYSSGSQNGAWTVNPDLTGSTGYATGNTFSVFDFGFVNPAGVPTNLTVPTITGSPSVGQTLSASPGTWLAAVNLAYQWLRCNEAGENCSDVVGASGPSYVVSTTDMTFALRVRVTASNAYGVAMALSAARNMDRATLLASFVPRLEYDGDEWYFADAVNEITDNYVSGQYTNYLENVLGYPLAFSDPSYGENVLSLDYLGEVYPSGLGAHQDDFIDEEGNYSLDASRMHALSQYRDRVYGRVVPLPNGDTILQYWFWYYYNDRKQTYGLGNHEGDFEMIQVRLNPNLQPISAAYAQHDSGEQCDWIHVEHGSDQRPVVYVADGSHASYFSDGDHYWDAGAVWDYADGLGPTVSDHTIADLTVSGAPAAPQRWLGWPGRYGSTTPGLLPFETPSPRGPLFQGSKWDNPLAWEQGIPGCSEEQVFPRPEPNAPPAPKVRVRRDGANVLIRYHFDGSIKPTAHRPMAISASIDPKGRITALYGAVATVTDSRGVIVLAVGERRLSGVVKIRVRNARGARSVALEAPLRAVWVPGQATRG